MTRPTTTGSKNSATAHFRTTLLDRLGLGADANDQDIEGTHRDIIDFLDSAPEGAKGWARGAAGEVDEAFALLTGPQTLLAKAAAYNAGSGSVAAAAHPAPAVPAAPAPASKLPWILSGILAAALLVFGVYWIGSNKSTDVPSMTGQDTTATQQAEPTPTVDKAALAEFMKKIEANPKDVEALRGAAEAYYAGADFKNSLAFFQKILAIDPKDEKALSGLGASQYNSGDRAGAEKTWLEAVKLYPNNQELHYSLGFYYMSTEPPQTDKMKAEWAKVVAIDPNSDLAKTVQQHVGSVGSAAPSASPSASK